MALVSTRPAPIDAEDRTTTKSASPGKAKEAEDDPDLSRAKDLVELHYSLRVKLAEGNFDQDLIAAREAVMRAVNQ